MPADLNMQLQASVTKTATFNGAGYDTINGIGQLNGLQARVLYSAANTASGAGTLVFSVSHSDDNSTWVALRSSDVIVLGTTATAGEVFLLLQDTKRYVRVSLATITGTTATVTYQADVLPSRP